MKRDNLFVREIFAFLQELLKPLERVVAGS
jgi:anthranilate phosphoribosyltransferase